MKKKKQKIYESLLMDIGEEIVLIKSQMSSHIYDLIKVKYGAAERIPYEAVIEKVEDKLNKTTQKDLILLRDLFDIIDEIYSRFFLEIVLDKRKEVPEIN